MRRKNRPQATTAGELIEQLKCYPKNHPVIFATGFFGRDLVVLSVYENKRTVTIDIGPEEKEK